MIVLEQSEHQLEWTDTSQRTYHNRRQHDRSSGVHLSGVIRYVAVALGWLTEQELADSVMPLRMAIGVAVEEYLATMYADLNYQPGELMRDGVYGNPDGFRPHMQDWLKVWECKATWLSLRQPRGTVHEWKDIRKQWMYQHQCMGYVNMVREFMPDCRWAELHVVYVNGLYDWTPEHGGPRYVRYLMEYSDAELDGNWNMVQKYRHKAVSE